MDKSLDEIVATTRVKGGRRGGPRRSAGSAARAQVLGHSTPSPGARSRAAVNVAAPAPAKAANVPAAEKIMVSNLPLDVNEAQIEELFQTTVGPLRKVQLNYDAQGRSKGVAYVQFQRRGDGRKAYEQYNNRLIDGKRAMKIEVIVDLAALPGPPTLAARVAPSPTATPASNGTQNARRGGGRGRGRGRGGARRNDRPAKSAQDLDAEMEDYTAQSGPTTAAAPAATAA